MEEVGGPRNVTLFVPLFLREASMTTRYSLCYIIPMTQVTLVGNQNGWKNHHDITYALL